MDCISYIFSSMGVSGIPSTCLLSYGIKQGYLISPYIFVRCLEYLGFLNHEKTSLKAWKTVKASKSGLTFFHLFFVDNLILFGQAFLPTAEAIEEVLTCFCQLCGQKVNNEKFKILFSKNTPEATRIVFVTLLASWRLRSLINTWDSPSNSLTGATRILISLFKLSKANWLVGKLISYP